MVSYLILSESGWILSSEPDLTNPALRIRSFLYSNFLLGKNEGKQLRRCQYKPDIQSLRRQRATQHAEEFLIPVAHRECGSGRRVDTVVTYSETREWKRVRRLNQNNKSMGNASGFGGGMNLFGRATGANQPISVQGDPLIGIFGAMLSQPVHFLLNVFFRGDRRDAPHHNRWNHVNIRRVLGAAIRGASLVRRFIGRIAIQPLAELESLLRRQCAYRFDNLIKCEQRYKNISAEVLAQPLRTRGVRGGYSSGCSAEDVNGKLYPKRPPKGPGRLRRRNSKLRPNALQTQKWNLNPSWKMRWRNPPVAINFLFEVVRMFVPVRVGLPAASTV